MVLRAGRFVFSPEELKDRGDAKASRQNSSPSMNQQSPGKKRAEAEPFHSPFSHRKLDSMPTIHDAPAYLVPLFQAQDDPPAVCGTATFVSINRSKYLITAAHVLDESDTIHFGRGIIMESATARAACTSGPGSVTRANDRLDIAVVLLSNEHADRLIAQGRRPLDYDEWDVDDIARPGQSYVFTGYPANRAKFDQRQRTVDLGPMSASCVAESESSIRAIGVDPRTHIVGRFDRRRMMNQQGRQITAPGPWGMSGGPVWTQRLGSEQLALVGVGIEYHKSRRVLVGTRIGAAVVLLRASFPETLPHLPEPRYFMVGAGVR
jgi:hypothetical protein